MLKLTLTLGLCVIATVGVGRAEEEALPTNRPADWTCFVTIKNNLVALPDEPEDGLLVLETFVVAGSSCQAGDVYVGVYPEGDCFVSPRRDPNREERMTFSYKPRVLKIRVEPGNQAAGIFEISTPNHGFCTFNTYIASCGTAIPPGAKCESRKLDDPRATHSGGVKRQFNRIP